MSLIIKKLSEVCLSMHQGINTVADKIEYQKDGIPIIQSKNITSGYLDLNDVRYVSKERYGFYKSKYNPNIGDILVCNIGTIGKSLLIKEDDDFLIAWNLFLIKIDKSKLSPGYLKCYLDFLNKRQFFNKFLTGGTVKFINKKTMGDVPVPILPLSAQNHISNQLNQIENLIAQRKESIRLLDEFLKSTFLEMFGDPVRNEMGWERCKFSGLAEIDRKQAMPSEFNPNDYYIGLEDIQKETGSIIKTSAENAEDLKSSKFRFTNNHVLYAKLRPYLNKVGLPDKIGICSTDIFPILPIKEVSNKYFICYLMRSNPFVNEMNSKSAGANLPRASAIVIENFQTYKPPFSLQNQFAQIVESTEVIKAQYQNSLHELESLYGSLSQRAFKGELSAKDGEMMMAAEAVVKYQNK